MSKFNNSIMPNKVRIEWHFSSNKYACRDAYSAHKSIFIIKMTPTLTRNNCPRIRFKCGINHPTL